ncbi:MAG TPA: leucyl aminopeptidase [candidate division Zixibacteria bacterium]|nr:leucyl aminopeptidase [candidate division Zixibacteria bacterium]
MKVTTVIKSIKEIDEPLVLIGLTEPVKDDSFLGKDTELKEIINEIIDLGDFKGEKNEFLFTYSNGKVPSKRLLLIGLGKEDEISVEFIRKVLGDASRSARDKDVKKLAVNINSFTRNNLDLKEITEALVQGLKMGSFQNLKYRTKDLDKYKKLEEIILFSPDFDEKIIKQGVNSGEIIAQSVNLCRKLSWGPANYITPTKLAEVAEKIADKHEIKVSIFDRKKSQEIGLTSFLAVAQGTEEPPKFIILEYGAEKKNVDTIALIGKAITFDSGGISIKPSLDMGAMKADMTGGAVVLSVMNAIAQLKPNVHVIGLVPATDNMPSGKAYHPGDIITSYDGQTIEVISTDAEGRMIINDALAYAAKNYKPKAMIDFATLTGSMMVALGNHALGYFANDEELNEKFKIASETSGEKIWRMPLWEDYDEQLKSDIADMKHTGGRAGGAITAARFLSKFVANTPWIHCDIAGYSSSESDKGYNPKGSKGPAVRLIIDLLRNWK